MHKFDHGTLDELAILICGDDGPLFRASWQLHEFFRRSKVSDVPEYDGPTRRAWTQMMLNGDDEDNTNAELAALRLADQRGYHGEMAAYEETLQRLTEVLVLEGLRIGHDKHGVPLLEECDTATKAPTFSDAKLKVSMAEVVSDPALAAVAQQRLDEARLCHATGAYVATIIMLGSMLEGILIGAAIDRLSSKPTRPPDKMGLQELIDLAHREGWIQIDVHKGTDLIRFYRNLVHPYAQIRGKHAPDADTVDICWSVVNATLNDLAATDPRRGFLVDPEAHDPGDAAEH